jgi:signal transduction histidine kinase
MEALRRGADGLTIKPFTSEELIESVLFALSMHQQKQDVQKLQAIRPLFDVTERLFGETEPLQLESLLIESMCHLLHCGAVGVFDFPANTGDVDPSAQTAPHGVTFERPGMPREVLVQAAHRVKPNAPSPVIAPTLDLKNLGVGPTLGTVLGPVRPTHQGGNVSERILVAVRSPGDPPFQEAEIETFLILCRQGAAALENATLHTALRETIHHLEASQRALIQSEKMATVGRLMATIAHEINNPLQSVQNCLHLAGRTELPTESRESYLSLAQEELERLMHIVQRMLGYYRPGRLDRKPASLNDLIERVVTLAHKKMEDQKVQLVLDLGSNLPSLLVVGDQIQQVILNLVLNACEAMPDGGKIHITTRKNGELVETWIEDTGPGVEPEQRERLFEPFASTKEDGTGLGLSVSYGIISAHGGILELIEDKHTPCNLPGACFRITLRHEEN